MPQYTVPFLSQYADLGHHEWRARGCGITALKMVMDYWHGVDARNQAISLDELLSEGLASQAYREGVGWTHRGLAELAQSHGYESFNVDFAPQGKTPKALDEAWSMLVVELERGPVLASVYAGMDPNRGGGHIVVVTGFHDGMVLFNDPEEMAPREGQKSIALEAFLLAFKRRYIVVCA